jgi:hypothetical protein
MPDSADWTNSPFGTAQRGARMPDDLIYDFLKVAAL